MVRRPMRRRGELLRRRGRGEGGRGGGGCEVGDEAGGDGQEEEKRIQLRDGWLGSDFPKGRGQVLGQDIDLQGRRFERCGLMNFWALHCFRTERPDRVLGSSVTGERRVGCVRIRRCQIACCKLRGIKFFRRVHAVQPKCLILGLQML
jgi:hypothetical protein